VNVRPLAVPDVAAAAALEHRTFSDPWSAQSFREMLAATHAVCLAAEEGGALVGYAVGTVAADEGEVLNIAVDEAARGRGLGRQLLRALVERLEQAGARSLFLEVRASNETAIGLYESQGFRILGRRKGYYKDPKEDAVTMVRNGAVLHAKK
jgi:[ribosomal protein S18]-alanine N-acetyltransferase